MAGKKEVSPEVATKALEAIRLARQTGSIRKGANETTKSVERGLATLVVIAGDVTPEEVVMHIPMICDQRKIPYLHVPAKLDLGKAIGLSVPCAAVAIEKPGEADKMIKDIASKITGREAPASGSAPQQSAPKPQEKKPNQAPKEQKKQ